MIDIDEQITDVERRVGKRTVEAGEARMVTLSRTYATDVDDLWDCCTNPERIPRWFLPVTGDLRVGGRYQLEGNAGGEVLTCETPHRFEITWEFGEQTSTVEVELTPIDGDTTRFELRHIALIDDHWGEFGPGAVGIGWDLALIGLGLHVASGETVDAVEVNAWSASEAGRTFVIQSGRDWGEAAVAAGDPAGEARAAAERTIAAYTGGDAAPDDDQGSGA